VAITTRAEIVCHMAEKVFGPLHFSFNGMERKIKLFLWHRQYNDVLFMWACI